MVWKFAFNYEIKEGWGEGEGETKRENGRGTRRKCSMLGASLAHSVACLVRRLRYFAVH